MEITTAIVIVLEMEQEGEYQSDDIFIWHFCIILLSWFLEYHLFLYICFVSDPGLGQMDEVWPSNMTQDVAIKIVVELTWMMWKVRKC